MGERKFVLMVQDYKDGHKIFFFLTKGPMTSGLCMQHWGIGTSKVNSNDDLGLSFFMAR